MSLNQLFRPLLSILCYGEFLWVSADETDWLEAPNPPLSLVGSQDHGVTEDQQLPRKEAWSLPWHLFIFKPPYNTLCCIFNFNSLTFSYVCVTKAFNVWSFSQSLYVKLDCSYMLIFNMFVWTCAYWGARSLFQWPAAWCSLCFWAPSVEWSGPVWRGAVYCSLQLWEQ